MENRSIPHNEHAWLIEPFFEVDSFIAKRMFGCLACYLHGKLMLVLADGEEPWDGVLVATDRSLHAALIKDYPELSAHPMLGKWLYIPANHERFERCTKELVKLCCRSDVRIGVVPSEKKRRARKRKIKKTRR